MSTSQDRLTGILNKVHPQNVTAGTKVSLNDLSFLIEVGRELTVLNAEISNGVYCHQVRYEGKDFTKLTRGNVEYYDKEIVFLPTFDHPYNFM